MFIESAKWEEHISNNNCNNNTTQWSPLTDQSVNETKLLTSDWIGACCCCDCCLLDLVLRFGFFAFAVAPPLPSVPDFLRTFFVFGNLLSFLYFMRLFWNHILICRSDSTNVWAISMRRRRVRYLLKWNSFSNSRIWCRVYAVRSTGNNNTTVF